MLEIVLILQLIVLAVAVYAARKAFWAARIALDNREAVKWASSSTTRQLEELDGLYRRLELERGSLPPTRGWAASPDFLNILYDRIRRHGLTTIVECGSGVTTLVAARALQQAGNGRILSLEHDAHYASATEDALKRLGLQDFVEIQLAPLAPLKLNKTEHLWYDRDAFSVPQEIDLIIVDGPPTELVGDAGRYPVGPVLFNRLSRRGGVLLDDTNRPGEREVITRLLSEFPGLKRSDLHAEKGCVLLTQADTE